MKKNTGERILAIDPGTKHMGVAFLDKGKLLYSGVKVIQERKSPHEIMKAARNIILRLISDYQPQVVVAEKTFFATNRSAALLNVLYDEIKSISKRKRLRFVSYAPGTMKKFISGDGRASKKTVARMVILRYPELKAYLTQDRKWKESFQYNMFDAVALGIMAGENRKGR